MNSRLGTFLKIAIVAFSCFCVFTVVKLQIEYNELKQESAALEDANAQLEELIVKLKSDLAAPVDEEYIIKTAKDKLNLRLPEEIIFYNDMSD